MKQALGGFAPYRARSFARTAAQRFKRATWAMRCLPDFLIVGAQKAGTSSLHAYLSQHPQIIPASIKEVHFFCGGLSPEVDSYAMGERWYRAHFPLRKALAPSQRTFEATPLYMFNPLAAERIAALVPQAKIIMLLRNPTERAVSHYFHALRLGFETLGINEALRLEEERLEPFVMAKDYKSDVFRRNSYKARGLYKQQLERYFRYFDRKQIMVLTSEQFFLAPRQTLKRVFEFVGVDPGYQVPNLSPQNMGTNRTKVEPGVYDYLNEFFELPNSELYEMLGEDYGW